MAGSVIVAGARTPIGKLSGASGRLQRRRARRVRDQGRARAGRPHARRRSTTSSWARCSRPAPGQITRPPGRGQRRHPDDRAGHHRQQGVPVGPQLDLPRRPDDPGRRGRHRGRRRHGVDDQRAVPAARGPGRLPPRRPDGRRLDDVRRPVLRLRPGRHGRRHREVRRLAQDLAREPQDELAAKSPRAGRRGHQGRPVRRRDRSRSRSRSARATRSSSTPTRACVRGTTAESLGGLRPAFDKAGNITAGNASQISDGGAAVIVTSKAAGRGARRRRRSARSSATARSPGPTRRCSPSRRAPSRSRSRRRASRFATSTCSSSTRRSPPSASRRWPTSASPTRSST